MFSTSFGNQVAWAHLVLISYMVLGNTPDSPFLIYLNYKSVEE